MTELERKMYEKYFWEEVYTCYNIDEDTDKVYKLVAASRLFDERIYEDLLLLHHFRRMYGESALYHLLHDEETGHSLFANTWPDTFGYNRNKERFEYYTTLVSETTEKIEVVIATDGLYPQGALDKLKVWTPDFWTSSSISSFVYYASYILDFVKKFIDWDDEFKKIIKKFLIIEYHDSTGV